MKLTTNEVNYLNVGLMIVSCVLAYLIPFELFLFAYAVLGPLHYLTEISWLHDRKYFVEAKRARERKGRRVWLTLVAVTLAVMLYGFTAEKVLQQNVTPIWEIALFYLVFVTASQLWFSRKKSTGIAVIALTAVLLMLFFSSSRYYALIAFFLITI